MAETPEQIEARLRAMPQIPRDLRNDDDWHWLQSTVRSLSARVVELETEAQAVAEVVVDLMAATKALAERHGVTDTPQYANLVRLLAASQGEAMP